MKIRVLGTHLQSRAGPAVNWSYHAEVYDDVDPSKPVWACEHQHESPQLAHGCAANWVEEAEEAGHQQTA